MSSAVVSTSAALGRPFVFDDEAVPELCPEIPDLFSAGHPPQCAACIGPSLRKERLLRMTSITPASRLSVRPTPEMASSGVSAIDALAGGLPRGCLTEICGPASSGRTTVLLAALAAATQRGEFCVLVDASDALDPHSVAAAGVELERLLWVRCGESSPQKSRAQEKFSQAAFKSAQAGSRKDENCLEQLLRATDMLLGSGGFGLIALDLCDVPLPAARRIPLTTWFRYRRAVEHTPTVLLALEQHPIAGSCSSLLLNLGKGSSRLVAEDGSAAKRRKNAAHGVSRGLTTESDAVPEGRKNIYANGQSAASLFVEPAHAQLLTGLEITVELIRSRLERKPTCSTSAAFAGKTAWAG